jgi:hypothetical protein
LNEEVFPTKKEEEDMFKVIYNTSNPFSTTQLNPPNSLSINGEWLQILMLRLTEIEIKLAKITEIDSKLTQLQEFVTRQQNAQIKQESEESN